MSDWSFDKVDLSGIDEGGGRLTLRPGNHEVKISSAELKTTKQGTGKYIEVRLESENGQYVTDRINVKNPSAKAQEIGLARLKSLLTNANHPTPDNPKDINSLVGLSVGVRVETGPDWKDGDGNVRPGGGQPRQNGAYFMLNGSVMLGEVDEGPTMKAPKTESPAPSSDSDADIPF